MKRSIEWHKENISNATAYIQREQDIINKAQASLDKRISAFDLYFAQIELAESEGRDEFDRDKYAIRRLCG